MRKLVAAVILVGTMLFALTVPDFKLTKFDKSESSLYPLIQGNKLTVVGFFTTTCHYCRSEMSDFNAMSRRYEKQGIRFVGVFLDNDISGAKALTKENKLTYPVATGGGDIVEFFNLKGVPYTVIVDARGNIVHKIPGYAQQSSFEGLLESFSAKN